jgi:hypothetical protein
MNRFTLLEIEHCIWSYSPKLSDFNGICSNIANKALVFLRLCESLGILLPYPMLVDDTIELYWRQNSVYTSLFFYEDDTLFIVNAGLDGVARIFDRLSSSDFTLDWCTKNLPSVLQTTGT